MASNGGTKSIEDRTRMTTSTVGRRDSGAVSDAGAGANGEDAARAGLDRLRDRLNAALRGKPEVVDHVLECLLARGHLLLEDLPGLGKTTLAKALARGLGGTFARVQCTPDLLPGDVTGFKVYHQKTQEFQFLPGPVFADVLLADEINRATPRTQSALLEAMAEQQVTIDNTRHPLAETFFVIATQNPVEQHGTYPLPEAQLDRFAIKLSIGYPDPDAETEILAGSVGRAFGGGGNREEPPALSLDQLAELQRRVASVAVARSLQRYLVDLAGAIRRHPRAAMGLSPRGVLMWQRLAQARAFLDHRDFATPDDLLDAARPALSVRLGLDEPALERVLREATESVPVPVSVAGSDSDSDSEGSQRG